MKRKAHPPPVDLKLNLSPPVRANREVESPKVSGASSSEVSPRSSCVSMEVSSEDQQQLNSPEASSMVLVGCPRCLMYVMLSEVDRKCPKCKSTVLLDFLNEEDIKRPTN